MNRLFLQVTYKCTSQCQHCFYCSGPKCETVLSSEAVERIIEQTRPSEYVLFTGGEPSLAPDVVLRGLAVAKSLGIASWFCSNGSWGRDRRYADEFASAMTANGLVRALISVDALHQEFIPFDSVVNAIGALRTAGIKTIKVLVTFVDRRKHLPIDQRTEELVKLLNSEPGVTINPEVSFVGRAIYALNTYAPKLTVDAALDDHCEKENASGMINDLSTCSSSFSTTIGAEGKVFICPSGFAYPGDLNSMSFADIVSKENIWGNKLMSNFQSRGVRGLFDYAIGQGYIALESYANKHHLCWHVRDFLRPKFPDILTPTHAYIG